ncbi:MULTISPECIES: vWA domain-containing protein [unclassified Marinovum]
MSLLPHLRATLALVALLPTTAFATCTEDAMLVFDASGSMAEMGYNGLDVPRINDARRALHEALPQVTPVRRVGLVVYGPARADAGETDSCSFVDLRLPPTPDAAARILFEIDSLTPDGNTALTRAVEFAAEALDYRTRPGTIVLVTDGKETCGGAPCQLASDLAANGANLTVHVIGFRVRGAFFNWEGGDGNPEVAPVPAVADCLAHRTGGLYAAAETTDELVTALRQTLGCTLFSGLPPARRQG